MSAYHDYTGHADMGLEHKFARLGVTSEVEDGVLIEGYASYFGQVDNGNDVVTKGAYAKSLTELAAKGGATSRCYGNTTPPRSPSASGTKCVKTRAVCTSKAAS